MEPQIVWILLSVILIASPLAFYAYKLHGKNKGYEQKFSAILNVEKEVARIAKEKSALEESIAGLRQSYKEKKNIFDDLVRLAAIYDESIELAELGFYKPHYDFDTSEQYKEEINRVREKQKEMISQKTAITCDKEWVVSGSKTKGQTMTSRGIRLTARAFNNECDAAISNTSWNNAERMAQRIQKTFEAINKLNESNFIIISETYLNLKLQEFRLAYEYQDKKHKQKEEQAAIRQQMREEAELEQEIEAASKEEDLYQKMIEKAKKEAEKATGEKLTELEEKITALNADLAIAHAKMERAKSMAQQTKAGHVYVISNIGSFGEDVYKIGMTRRLEPDERVKELGDASVPFNFDVHAMLYSTDAPTLENTLHKAFDIHRVNLVNDRKEFFKVSLDHIEKVVKENFGNAEFHLTAEARQYRESAAIRAQRSEQKTNNDVHNKFPSAI